MMLRMEGFDGGSSESGSYVYENELEGEEEEDGDDDDDEEDHLDHPEEDHGSVEGSDYGEDAFDANDEEELNPADFESDEAFARALQDAEEREIAVRLMAIAGLNDCEKDSECFGALRRKFFFFLGILI